MAKHFLANRKGADIASATTITPGTDGDRFDVTGTTTITTINSGSRVNGCQIFLLFTGILTFTHNGTSLILKGATNATTAAGNMIALECIGTNQWREIFRNF